MKITEYIDRVRLQEKNEAERAKLLCFYYSKENGEKQFTLSRISSIMVDRKNTLEFIPAIYQRIDQDWGSLWEDTIFISSDSELIDEIKFCGKRNYLDQLIYQINHSYANNCFDAAAVLMRRLFEVLLVLTYQNMGIDNEIKDSSGNGYIMLDGIVKKAKNNSTIKLSRIKMEFDSFRMIGNFSAHNITYTAGKKDIDDIKLNYRVMLEELYNKAGLL